jgi:hypothetical protein
MFGVLVLADLTARIAISRSPAREVIRPLTLTEIVAIKPTDHSSKFLYDGLMHGSFGIPEDKTITPFPLHRRWDLGLKAAEASLDQFESGLVWARCHELRRLCARPRERRWQESASRSRARRHHSGAWDRRVLRDAVLGPQWQQRDDWVSDAALTPAFEALPGASFIINGARRVKDAALISAGAELRLANGISLLAKFDGEFSSHTRTYAGTGAVRRVW